MNHQHTAPRYRLLFTAALSLALAACTTVQPTISGFLPGDLPLVPEDGKQHLLSGADGMAMWNSAEAYRLDPIVYRPVREALDSQQAAALLGDFEVELRESLEATWRPAEVQETRVVRVRAAVTDVETVNPVVNGFTMMLLGLPVDNGGASVELELLDANGQVLYRMSAAGTGNVFQFWKGLNRRAFARSGLKKLAQHVGEHVNKRVAEVRTQTERP